MKIGFIGVGKLGQPCAEAMADVEEYDVVGYDIAPRTPKNFPMVDTIEEAVRDRDLVFVAVQTPHDPRYDGSAPTAHLKNKDFDYTIVKDVLSEINKYATKDQLVVLISTVLPGTTRRELQPLLTNTRFIYNPYLIAMGTVRWDMVNPEMVIIGTEDGSETGDAKLLIEFYEKFMVGNPYTGGPVRYVVGTWDEAESIKIFYNTFISAKVSIVNMIQDVAERSGNINVDVVTDALKNSSWRVTGPSYFKAGMGDGGPCHPRDNIALRWMAENLGLEYDLFDAIMYSREIQAKNLAKKLVEKAEETGLPIVILGKSYKPGVDFLDGSYSLLVGHFVEEFGHEVTYDPKQLIPAVYLLGHWKEFNDFDFISPSVVVDPWREYTSRTEIEVIHYGNTRHR